MPDAVHPWPAAFVVACPACRRGVTIAGGSATCSSCAATYLERDGIWRMLTPEAAARLSRFVADYEAIRQAEGRGSDDAAWYRGLPETDAADPFHGQWRIRATSFATFIRGVLAPLESEAGRPLTVLDLGGGVGWLANQVARRGHVAAAVDLSDDARDGLGAWHRYETAWLPVQAEFDALPFADAAVDLVAFNASLHYSTDIAATLREAKRVIRPDGRIVIIDTPLYRDPASGRQMLAERADEFERRFGRRSDSLPVEGFLTDARIAELGADLGLEWTRISPRYGLAWATRPIRARLRGRREPATFPILVGRR